ncbi:MAG: hypothetical protein J5J06_02530 [Phycisphaerae bacterium]|nr:hypothetical protein [Phycisphaerae bacterium]
MPLEPLALMLLVVLGCAAFFFCVIYATIQVMMAMINGVARLFRPRSKRATRRPYVNPLSLRYCPRPECRRVEDRPARFCSVCGAKLEAPGVIPIRNDGTRSTNTRDRMNEYDH